MQDITSCNDRFKASLPTIISTMKLILRYFVGDGNDTSGAFLELLAYNCLFFS